MKKTKIWIRGTNWIGDALLTFPAITRLRTLYPDARIDLSCAEKTVPLMSLNPALDQVHPMPAGGISSLIKWLKGNNFDMAVFFQNSPGPVWAAWSAGIAERIGSRTLLRALFLSQFPRRKKNKREHQVYHYLSIVDSLNLKGQKFARPEIILKLSESTIQEAKSKVNGQGGPLGLVPGAAYGTAKRWFPERFREVIQWWNREFSARQVFLFGSAVEEKLCDEISRDLNNISNFAGKTSLSQSAALMKQCSCILSNDTGAMHLAAAVSVPLVVVFGSTDARETSPFTEKVIILKHPFSCSPCLNHHCPMDHRCMDAVHTEEVIQSIKKWVQG